MTMAARGRTKNHLIISKCMTDMISGAVYKIWSENSLLMSVFMNGRYFQLGDQMNKSFMNMS